MGPRRVVCRNAENTLDTTSDWDLVELDATGQGEEGSGSGEDAPEEDGEWDLESMDHHQGSE